LSDQTEDYEDLYENAPCGYLSLRANGSIFKSNLTFTQWTGYESEKLAGMKFYDLLNIAGRIYYETHFAPLLRMQGHFNEVALEIVKADGSRLPVLVNAAERRDADGKAVFTRLTIFNASDRRRYERELLAARDELRRLNANLETRVNEVVAEQLRSSTELGSQREEAELREQFIAVLSHDLRNPLASISAGIRLLAKNADAREISVCTMMEKSVLRMSGLIANVMDFARGRLGGGIMLNPSVLPLQPTLQQVIDELQSTHPEVVIKTDLQVEGPVLVDHIRVAQLLSNLLGNALTHGLNSAPVSVKATVADRLEIAVCNQGNPISPEAMERLFSPFSRGEIRPSQQGLGLGLYIASEIARAHGGRIDVTSTPELTCFTFHMPVVALRSDVSRR
jgi:sigma-B regulation protein RsbU (phosphoserine phosphatase)